MRDRLARLLIRLCVAPGEREAILGDLDEARQRVTGDVGPRAARRWYLRQAGAAAAYGVGDRGRALWQAFREFHWGATEFRQGARTLLRTPGMTMLAVLSLGVGIGATTAMFGLVYAVLLQPLALPHPEQLVVLERATPRSHDDWFSGVELAALASADTRITLVPDRGIDNVPLTIGGDREYVAVDAVGGRFFETLALQPRIGRLIDAADEASGAHVIVIAQALWEATFNADPRAIGSRIDVNGTPFVLIGVTPEAFHGLDYPGSFRAAVPITSAAAIGIKDDLRGTSAALGIVGRLRPGGAPAAVLGALDAVFQRCCRQSADEHLVWAEASHGVGGKDDMRDELRGSLLALLGAVVLVLVIACLNVANLFMIRGERRARELALRMSLGASRARVVSQLLAESVMVAIAAGALGLAIASCGRMLLSQHLPRNVSVMRDLLRFHVDTPVLFCTLAAAAITVLLAGVLPALRSTQLALAPTLKSGDRLANAGGGQWIERAGVSLQVALALLLVTSASLLAGTLNRLSAVDSGLRPEDVYVAAVETRGTSLEAGGIVPIHAAVLERVRAMPGVTKAGLATYVPFFGGRRSTRDLQISGTGDAAIHDVILDAITPGFFGAIGIRLSSGRDISEADAAGADPVVILSESTARRLGLGGDAVGKQIRVTGQTSMLATVVGVARDAKLNDLRAAPPLIFYMPVTQTGLWPFLELTVRAPKAPADFDRLLQRAVNDVAPAARVRFASTLETEIRAATSRERFSAALASAFAVIALGLAALGLYGLMTQQVARRHSELGVRVALGARGVNLIALVSRSAMRLVVIGLAIGFPLSLAATRLIAPELYGLRSWEPSSYAWSMVALAITAIVAVALPARRAAQADPLIALKNAG
jgi:predicted permease